MPSGTITAGCLAGALSLVLALRSFRAHLAAQSLSHVAPMTVAALLAALKGESKSTVRSGDLVAVSGVAWPLEEPLRSINNTIAVIVRTVARKLFSTIVDPRSVHSSVLGVSTHAVDWGVADVPTDGVSTAVASLAETAQASPSADAAVLRVVGGESAAPEFPFMVAGGTQTSTKSGAWLWKVMRAITSWGRMEEGTSFTQVCGQLTTPCIVLRRGPPAVLTCPCTWCVQSVLPVGAPITVVGTLAHDSAGRPAVVPHSSVGLAILRGSPSPSGAPPVTLGDVITRLRHAADYRLMMSLMLGAVSAYLIWTGIRRRRRERRRRHGDDGGHNDGGNPPRQGRRAVVEVTWTDDRGRSRRVRRVLVQRGGGGGGAPGGITDAMAAADTPAEGGDGSADCIVCYERKRCCVFLECGHRACCATCALVLVRSPAERRKCPLCRKFIVRAVKVFDV